MILEKKRRRDAKDAWLDSIDPLNGLSITQAKSTYNVARRHGSPLLQKIYSEIEACDPTLMTCVERRQSALAGLGWRAVANASAQDESLAEEQRRALEEFANGIENLDEAIEHLDLAFFRGYSVVQPIWQSGTVRRVNLLDSWNFLKDDDGNLLWNPACSLDPKECEVITPAARVVKLVRRRAIDWPALIVYIRKYIGERDWGRFLERYGLPPVDAVMAPNTTDEHRDDYVEAAEAARDGRAVVWPSGTTTSRAEGARGQDPFSPFIEHQEKQIVLMATGGTLTSLAQADTGSLAGGAQMDVWEQIVARDGVVISSVLNRGLFVSFLQERFPGKPLLAHVELGREDEPSAVEAADLAGKLKGAGYTVDQAQLEEATGLTLVKDEIQPPGGLGGLSLNKKDGKTPLQNDENRLQNAPRDPDGQGDPSDKTPSQNANLGPNNQLKILEAFARDNSPAAKAVAALLQNPGKESAEQLLKDLPTLLPKDPDLAAVIADAMAAEFASALEESTVLTNKISNPCPNCHRQMTADNICTFCARRAENIKKVDGLIDELGKKSPDGKHPGWSHKEETLGEVDSKTAAAISAAMPGIDAEGQLFEVDTTQMKHALKDHGVGREKNESQIPITTDDLRRIPDVLFDYDEIVPGKGIKDGKKNNAVVFKKKFEDGTLACVEIDQYSEKRKGRILRFKTMWKEKTT